MKINRKAYADGFHAQKLMLSGRIPESDSGAAEIWREEVLLVGL